MKKNAYIQIGTVPGWKRPVLNIVWNGKSFSTRITKKLAKELEKQGMAVEG